LEQQEEKLGIARSGLSINRWIGLEILYGKSTPISLLSSRRIT